MPLSLLGSVMSGLPSRALISLELFLTLPPSRIGPRVAGRTSHSGRGRTKPELQGARLASLRHRQGRRGGWGEGKERGVRQQKSKDPAAGSYTDPQGLVSSILLWQDFSGVNKASLFQEGNWCGSCLQAGPGKPAQMGDRFLGPGSSLVQCREPWTGS